MVRSSKFQSSRLFLKIVEVFKYNVVINTQNCNHTKKSFLYGRKNMRV